MAVVRCEAGHFYDDSKFDTCPHCKSPLPKNPQRGIGDQKTVFGPSDPSIAQRAMRQQVQVDLAAPRPGVDAKTVGIFRTEKGYDPVVGWLVCVEGREKGRDYRLHAGRNFIGRAIKSDIALVDDERISREDHCSIVFEPRRAVFLLARGEGDGVIVNGARLEENLELHGDERIEIGASAFVFVPFCGEGRSW